ncbi:hypothetical protein GUJ93_ZPchr0004g38123 [Zizania palustris]|uniref:Uncharacterized protein n=1 Tax=Zizania palustris TaxID=103762 RepID=A0A8J5V9F9_ZIZPA|nr:hypothetical protein GUJ93_ZPchr0004g38123 [Zizania palustris]
MPMPELLPDALQDEEDAAKPAARVRKPNVEHKIEGLQVIVARLQIKVEKLGEGKDQEDDKALYPKVLAEVRRLEASDLNSAGRSTKKEKGQR